MVELYLLNFCKYPPYSVGYINLDSIPSPVSHSFVKYSTCPRTRMKSSAVYECLMESG